MSIGTTERITSSFIRCQAQTKRCCLASRTPLPTTPLTSIILNFDATMESSRARENSRLSGDYREVASSIAHESARDLAVEEIDHLGRLADLAGEKRIAAEDPHGPGGA